MRSKHDQDLIDDWQRMARTSHEWEHYFAGDASQQRQRAIRAESWRRIAEEDAARYAWLAWVALVIVAGLLAFIILRGGL